MPKRVLLDQLLLLLRSPVARLDRAPVRRATIEVVAIWPTTVPNLVETVVHFLRTARLNSGVL